MKTPLTFLAMAAVSTTSASAFSVDFDGRTGTTLDNANSLTFDVAGYGQVRLSALNFGVLDVNQDFSIPGNGITEALEFDPGESIQVEFLNGEPHNINFAFVGVDVGSETFTSGVVQTPNIFFVEFGSTAVPSNTAALESITFNSVPEPSSTLLAGLGALTMLTRRRR